MQRLQEKKQTLVISFGISLLTAQANLSCPLILVSPEPSLYQLWVSILACENISRMDIWSMWISLSHKTIHPPFTTTFQTTTMSCKKAYKVINGRPHQLLTDKPFSTGLLTYPHHRKHPWAKIRVGPCYTVVCGMYCQLLCHWDRTGQILPLLSVESSSSLTVTKEVSIWINYIYMYL